MNETCRILLSATTCIFLFLPCVWGIDNTREDLDEAVWQMISKMLTEKKRDALPQVADALVAVACTSRCSERSLRWAFRLDGWHIQEEGCPEMLERTRSILFELLAKNKQYETTAAYYGLIYLSQKGDSRDLPLFARYLADPYVQTNEELRVNTIGMPLRILQTRAAGTNIVPGIFDAKLYPSFFTGDRSTYTTNRLAFLPSVVNTGPQAAYVYEAFGRAIFKELRSAKDGYETNMVKYIPPEMLTMRVWFDKEGKAVTDVDISKFGISVPGLAFVTNAPPNVRELKPVTELAKDTKHPQAGSSRSWVFLAVGFLLSGAIIISIYFKRRK